MKQIPQEELRKLVKKAEMSLQKSGTLKSALDELEENAKDKGYSVDRAEAKAKLVELMAYLVSLDAKDHLERMRDSMRY